MASLSGSSMQSSQSGGSKDERKSLGSWGKGRSAKPDEENAYASLSDHMSDDRTALSESIRQHASILRGDDDELDDNTFADGDDFVGIPMKNIDPIPSPALGTSSGHSYADPSTIQSESQHYSSNIQSESLDYPSTIQSDSQEPSTIHSSSHDQPNPYYIQYDDGTGTMDGVSFASGSVQGSAHLPPPPPRATFASQYYSSLSTIQTNATSLRSISNVEPKAPIPEGDEGAPDQSSIESSQFQPERQEEVQRNPSPAVPQPVHRQQSLYNKSAPIPRASRTFAVPLNSTRELQTPSPIVSADTGKPLQPALRAARKYSPSVAPQDLDSTSVGSYHSRTSYAPSVTSQSRVAFAETVHSYGAYTTNQPLGRPKKFRLVLVLFCLSISLGMALLYGHGDFGLWMTNQFIGSTAAKEGNYTGLPGAVGSPPAYNKTFEIPDLESMNIVLPTPSMEASLAEWRIPYPAATRVDTPLFWALPKAGGNAIMRILVNCLGLVEASGEGAGHNEMTLQILETDQGTRYVNVNTMTVEGLERAKILSLADSGMAEVMSTPLIPHAAQVFTPDYKGRLFAILRHPMERSMSIYNQAIVRDPTVADMSIADYASNFLPNNEMVRTLAYKTSSDDLSEADLYVAMEVLRRKGVVGLVDRIEESIQRFHGYFGWKSMVVDSVLECQEELLAPSADRLAAPAPGSEAYNLLFAQNRLDIRLFEYAQYLFDIQGGNSREAK